MSYVLAVHKNNADHLLRPFAAFGNLCNRQSRCVRCKYTMLWNVLHSNKAKSIDYRNIASNIVHISTQVSDQMCTARVESIALTTDLSAVLPYS